MFSQTWFPPGYQPKTSKHAFNLTSASDCQQPSTNEQHSTTPSLNAI